MEALVTVVAVTAEVMVVAVTADRLMETRDNDECSL